MQNFGEFLYELRKEKGMTQAELAEALGVTNKAVSKWETGEAMPETSLLLPISRIFGVTVDELLDGKRTQTEQKDIGGDGYIPVDEIKNHLFTRRKDEEVKPLSEKICGLLCGVLMALGITAYLLVGSLAGLWHPYWVIVPVCALVCGIIGVIGDTLNSAKREKKIARGENPYTGCTCGIIILVSIIVYLLLGALANLWHPYWTIIIGGVVVCFVVGAIGDIVFRNGKK